MKFIEIQDPKDLKMIKFYNELKAAGMDIHLLCKFSCSDSVMNRVVKDFNRLKNGLLYSVKSTM